MVAIKEEQINWMKNVNIIVKKCKRYWGRDIEELKSIALLSIVKADKTFDSCRSNNRDQWSIWKGYRVLIDDIRSYLGRKKEENILHIFNESSFVKENREINIFDLCKQKTFRDPSDTFEILIDGLMPSQKSLLKLYYIKGETHQEIADREGLEKSTICLRLKSVRKELKEKMLK